MRRPTPIRYNKPPTTFSDQIQLMQQRGLTVTDVPKAEHYLAQLNYYRLAAYCLPFEQDLAKARPRLFAE